MPRKRTRTTEEYSQISISVDDYEVRASGGINIELVGSGPITADKDAPVFTFDTSLRLMGRCNYPDDRAGHRFTVELLGVSRDSRHLNISVEDLYERDQYGSTKYKKYRHGSYPVVREPPSLGIIEKIRGEEHWHCWIPIEGRMVSDSMILVAGNKPVYISMTERKSNRVRHVRHISIQTIDPDIE